MAQSPYVNHTPDDRIEYDALGPRSAYAVPVDDSPHYDEAGNNWSVKLGDTFGPGTDRHRIGTERTRDFRTSPSTAPEHGFYAQRDSDKRARHSVEDIDADGWAEFKSKPPQFAPNPRSLHYPETRPTQAMAPRTYLFTRPFAQETPKRFTGDHFSMADHRRTYDILGMNPARSARNTFRIEPTRWDENIVDMPDDPTPQFNGKIRAIEVAPSMNRNYRLGG